MQEWYNNIITQRVLHQKKKKKFEGDQEKWEKAKKK